MKKTWLVVLASLVLGTGLWGQTPRGGPHQTVPEFLGYVQDEFIVVMRRSIRQDLVVRTDARGLPEINRPSLQMLLWRYGVTNFQRQFVNARPQPASSRLPDLTGHYKVKLSPGMDLDTAIRDFEIDPDVDHVERIGVHSLYQTPNDTYYQNPPPSFPYDQWSYWDANGIDADLAWDSETGDPAVLVANLDSGTRYFHLDLGGNSPQWGPGNPFTGGNVFVNPGEVPGNGQDDDGNGFTDDTIGWDFVSSAGGFGISCLDQDCGTADNNPDDGDGHGTHTSGTIAAITNNGILVAGVAGGFSNGTQSGTGNGVKLVPLRIGYHARYQGIITGIVQMDYAAQAMAYVADLVDAGFNVAAVNCSWGSSNSGGLNAAVDALLARDVMIIHAAGNSNSSSADFLGNKAGVMNVAATGSTGTGASFTNHGSWVDVAAPGVEILSTYRNPDDPDPGAHYIAVLDGTSMSAPHVAGIAALLESCSPTLSGPDKFNVIVGNTTSYSDSRDLGSGIANARLALDAVGCGGAPCDITAAFSESSTSGCAPLTVTFTDQSTGSGIDSWSWSFGDGGTSSAQNPSHAYASAGTYTVSLTASSATCSDTLVKTGLITVSDVPVADFSGSPTSGSVPLTVNFADLSSGSPTSWSWNFGDGGSSSAQNPSHTYTGVGSYSVTLTATNACGTDVITKSGYITVAAGPTCAFVFNIVVTRENLGGGNKRGVATVTIHDANGVPLQGATVTGDFSGKTSESGLTAVTNGNGQAVLFSGAVKGGGEWCFEVTNVTHPTECYDSAFNVVTQACESGPVF